jgi:hypothetical protein
MPYGECIYASGDGSTNHTGVFKLGSVTASETYKGEPMTEEVR